MSFAVCLLSVVPLRKEPSHRSEMVSQLVFGEFAKMKESKDDFVEVETFFDNYRGWVQANQLFEVQNTISTDSFTAGWCAEAVVNGKPVHLPFASPFYSAAVWESLGVKVEYQGKAAVWKAGDDIFNEQNLKKACDVFLNSPYLWGGRTVFGVDCSGFVQQVFKLFNIRLQRDAYLQAGQGIRVEDFAEALPGDLAFFHNDNGRIVHVGLLLSGHRIVHAAGRVRIDELNENGIVHVDSGKLTHQLHSIRRFSGTN